MEEIAMNQINFDIWLLISQIFISARDIPYRVYFQGESNQQKIIEAILRRGASCSAKHELIGKALQLADISIRYFSYAFKWVDLQIDYPKTLLHLAKTMPITQHTVIEINISDNKYLLDATWDKPLSAIGLPINDIDNILNCKLAIIPCEEPVIYRNIKEWDNYTRTKWLSTSTKTANTQALFYSQLNSWFKIIRA